MRSRTKKKELTDAVRGEASLTGKSELEKGDPTDPVETQVVAVEEVKKISGETTVLVKGESKKEDTQNVVINDENSKRNLEEHSEKEENAEENALDEDKVIEKNNENDAEQEKVSEDESEEEQEEEEVGEEDPEEEMSEEDMHEGEVHEEDLEEGMSEEDIEEEVNKEKAQERNEEDMEGEIDEEDIDSEEGVEEEKASKIDRAEEKTNPDDAKKDEMKNEEATEMKAAGKKVKKGKTKTDTKKINKSRTRSMEEDGKEMEIKTEEFKNEEEMNKIDTNEVKNKKNVALNSKKILNRSRKRSKKGGIKEAEVKNKQFKNEEVNKIDMNREENKQEVENSKEMVDKSTKMSKNKFSSSGANEMIPEDSGKKKVSTKKKKRAKNSGMIFMCSSKTKQDCYHYRVLGLPASKRDMVLEVYRGMKLFLFDYDLRLMYGIYEAAGAGGYNIEPRAFKSAFPAQVRFRVLKDCLPLAEEKFKKAIQDNYYKKNKFHFHLNARQVKNLCKLFLAASKGSKSRRLKRTHREEPHPSSSLDGDRWRKGGISSRQLKRSHREERHHVSRPSLHSGRLVLEREVFAPPLPPHQPPQSIAALPPVYAYGRSYEVDVYRQGLITEPDRRHGLDLEVTHPGEMEYDSYAGYREYPMSSGPLYSAVPRPAYRYRGYPRGPW